MAKTVRPEKMAAAIEAELSKYGGEVSEQIKKDVTEVANQCAAEIKAKSPADTGKYRRGWKTKTMYNGDDGIRILVYNSTKPQLSHLLEFGHTIKNGTGRAYGSVNGYEHIYPAEQKAKKALENKARVAVKRR